MCWTPACALSPAQRGQRQMFALRRQYTPPATVRFRKCWCTINERANGDFTCTSDSSHRSAGAKVANINAFKTPEEARGATIPRYGDSIYHEKMRLPTNPFRAHHLEQSLERPIGRRHCLLPNLSWLEQYLKLTPARYLMDDQSQCPPHQQQILQC